MGRVPHQERKNLVNQIKLAQKHTFWDTQPVKKFLSPNPEKDGQMVPGVIEKIEKEALPLPAGFEWTTVDMNSEHDQKEIYNLLTNHYVEDNEAIFRFDYQIEFLKWTLCVPNYIKEWHVGVKPVGKNNLLGFISATPVKTTVNEQTVRMAEINFLCVHKKLRSKKLAPILIKEITRRVNLHNIWSAVYTSGDVIPHPFSFAPYLHRSLNPKKNVETGFSTLPSNEPLARYVKRMKIHGLKDIDLIGTPRLMESKDIPQVYQLYKEFYKKYDMHFKFSQSDVGHHLMPRDKTIFTIVIDGEKDGKVDITDFVSFYSLPS